MTDTDAPPEPGAPTTRRRSIGYGFDRTFVLERWSDTRYAWLPIAELDRHATDEHGRRRPRWRALELEPAPAEPFDIT